LITHSISYRAHKTKLFLKFTLDKSIFTVVKYYLFLLFIFCFYLTSNSQTPPYYIIGSDEFSNIDVYSLIYDEETDVLYAGTNRGAYAYKQNEFRQITTSEDQIGSSLFQLKKDKNGELFCSNLSGQIFKIRNDSLHLIYELPKSEIKIDFRYYFDQENNIIINTSYTIMKVTPKDEQFLWKNNSDFFKKFNDSLPRVNFYNSTQMSDGKIYFSLSLLDRYLVYDGKSLALKYFSINKNRETNNFLQLGKNVYYNSIAGYANVENGELKPALDLSEKDIIYHLNENKSIAINNDFGFRYLNYENDIINVSNSLLPKIFVSTSFINSNGVTFLGTFKEGIIVITNSNIVKYRIDVPVKSILTDENDVVYLLNQKGNVIKQNNDFTKLSENLPKHAIKNSKYEELFLHKGRVAQVLKSDPDANGRYNYFENIKDLDVVDNEMFTFIIPSAIFIIPLKEITISKQFANPLIGNIFRIELKNRGRSVSYSRIDNHLYFSTSLGTYRKKWNTDVVETIKYLNTNIQSNDLVNYKGELFAGAERSGVLVFKDNIIQRKIDGNTGLKSNLVTKLSIKDDLLFILTTHGLQVYDLKSEEFIGLGESEGIVTNKVKDFAVSSAHLWLLDKEGYYPYLIEKIVKNINDKIGKLFFDSVIVNSIPINPLLENEFKFSENSFEFYFDYRNIETKKEAQILYKLEGVSKDWKKLETTINSVSFPSLSPGKYIFLIKANYRGKESEVQEYKFRIFQPIWFQWWFIVLGIFVLTSLSFVFYSLKLKRSKKNQEIELEKKKMQIDIFESKLKAIRSQMNPHFIFNSLNSIQALVLKNDKKKSYDYIEMFSDLVRKTLTFSEKSYVSIKEEVSFLEIYLNLESLRMKEEFTFSIINKIEGEIKVPSLLIQPFLENAIHHGLLHKPNDKNLTVTFEMNPSFASCIIEDNGIGRVRAAEINQRQQYRHESFSLNATEERLRILSVNIGQEFNYSIVDLYDEDGGASGTKVIVKFPYQHGF